MTTQTEATPARGNPNGTADADRGNVYQRKLAVMRRCEEIGFDAVHPHHGYDYHSVQNISNQLRRLAVEEGLDITPGVCPDNADIVHVLLTNVDDTEQQIHAYWPVVEGDKGWAYSTKFALIRTFLIGDKEEGDESEMANRAAQQTSRRNDGGTQQGASGGPAARATANVPLCPNPECRKPLRRSKPRPDQKDVDPDKLGWYCWKKPEREAFGCGATYAWNDPRVTGEIAQGGVSNGNSEVAVDPDEAIRAIDGQQEHAFTDRVLSQEEAVAVFQGRAVREIEQLVVLGETLPESRQERAAILNLLASKDAGGKGLNYPSVYARLIAAHERECKSKDCLHVKASFVTS